MVGGKGKGRTKKKKSFVGSSMAEEAPHQLSQDPPPPLPASVEHPNPIRPFHPIRSAGHPYMASYHQFPALPPSVHEVHSPPLAPPAKSPNSFFSRFPRKYVPEACPRDLVDNIKKEKKNWASEGYSCDSTSSSGSGGLGSSCSLVFLVVKKSLILMVFIIDPCRQYRLKHLNSAHFIPLGSLLLFVTFKVFFAVGSSVVDEALWQPSQDPPLPPPASVEHPAPICPRGRNRPCSQAHMASYNQFFALLPVVREVLAPSPEPPAREPNCFFSRKRRRRIGSARTLFVAPPRAARASALAARGSLCSSGTGSGCSAPPRCSGSGSRCSGSGSGCSGSGSGCSGSASLLLGLRLTAAARAPALLLQAPLAARAPALAARAPPLAARLCSRYWGSAPAARAPALAARAPALAARAPALAARAPALAASGSALAAWAPALAARTPALAARARTPGKKGKNKKEEK
ncbi:hypothetical protein H6P81_003092 [Aristolochia fimbriata]|uniref:Uncharacterized protein n=1 Tax=Aristolochia fimbriata TaxID=158543 RepID=A0AAV7FDA4_ARIFI|nr:hypothetical protein H6P81_003092 [Aristolochia fimbriata]